MVTQGSNTNASQAFHLKDSQSNDAHVHNSPCLLAYKRTDVTVHYKNCNLKDKIEAIEDQILAMSELLEGTICSSYPKLYQSKRQKRCEGMQPHM